MRSADKNALDKQIRKMDIIKHDFYKAKVLTYLQMEKQLKHHHPFSNIRNFISAVMIVEYHMEVDNVILHLVTQMRRNKTIVYNFHIDRHCLEVCVV